jgi:3-oxoacyl-[acyl-carrier-protein] synthase-1
MEHQLKRDIWFVADSIVSSLGRTSDENYQAVRLGQSGISPVDFSKTRAHVSSIKDIKSSLKFTRFEAMCAEAIERAISNLKLPKEKTLFVLSTTKGNIALLERGERGHERVHLHSTAKHIASAFGFNHHIVISNACISGVMAIMIGRRYILSGEYDHVVVCGADELSEFIVSGFQSLSALSPELCKPFDANRKGVNLGESAAVVVITGAPEQLGAAKTIRVTGGGLSNDANHISGPSRTGNELASAVRQAMHEATVGNNDIGFISAHGTATLFNDEMEAKAFYSLGFDKVPVNSLKGSFGHTLGAAGVVETILSIHSLVHNEVMPTVGFETHGVSQPILVNNSLRKEELHTCIKTASGFGGCNAAIILQKEKTI